MFCISDKDKIEFVKVNGENIDKYQWGILPEVADKEKNIKNKKYKGLYVYQFVLKAERIEGNDEKSVSLDSIEIMINNETHVLNVNKNIEIISAYDYDPEVTVRNGQEITDVESIPIAISSIDTPIRLGYEVMTEEIKLNKKLHVFNRGQFAL